METKEGGPNLRSFFLCFSTEQDPNVVSVIMHPYNYYWTMLPYEGEVSRGRLIDRKKYVGFDFAN